MKLLILIFFISLTFSEPSLLQGALFTSNSKQRPILYNILIGKEILFPNDQIGKGQGCFGNGLVEVSKGDQLKVNASRQFLLYFTTKLSQSYNLQQSGINIQDITMSGVVLATNNSQNYVASLPITLNCEYKMHAYFRLKAFFMIKFYEQPASQQTKQYHWLLVCPEEEEITAFTNFYVPGYIIFWMLLNLSIQVYHNYQRGREYFAIFLIYLAASMLISNDLLAYFIAGGMLCLIVLKQRKRNAINNKMFTLYAFFVGIIMLQILVTFNGGKFHPLWNSFWIALDNFLILHISMFLTLRLIRLTRFRHIFWYFIAVATFALICEGNNNRFFEIQFKNPLNLNCIRMEVLFPILMLPISNFYSSLTSWMHRIVALGIVIISVLPLNISIKFMACYLLIILFSQIYRKDMVTVLRHRC